MSAADGGSGPSTAGPRQRGFVYVPDVPARRRSPTGFLLDALGRRRSGRALLSTLTVVLAVGGLGTFAYPLLTDLYTGRVVQERLADAFDRVPVEDWEVRETGAPLTRIVIPTLDVDTLVVEGTTPAALRAGAGHYPETPLPGAVGNVAIAGHRTTYGRPFNRVDELTTGDEIWLTTPVGDHRYVVAPVPDDGDCRPYAERSDAPAATAACVTHPMDWGVVAPTDEAVLTLTTCHPKGSARERLVVRATLAGSLPPGHVAAGEALDLDLSSRPAAG